MYADDHQFYAMSSDIEIVNDSLTQSAIDVSEWYTFNFLKGNIDKYRVLMLGSKLDSNINIIIDDDKAVTSIDCLELLGMSIDRRIRFDEHISIIYKKSSERVGVLMQLRNLISTGTKLQLFKAAILPYVTYLHLAWHFELASNSRKSEHVQERAFRAIYCDRPSSYNKLLNTANLCTLCQTVTGYSCSRVQ